LEFKTCALPIYLVGKAMTRRCCSICWDWARPLIRFPRAATLPGLPPTDGTMLRTRVPGNPYGWWVSPWHYGLNQGPIVLMIENYRSGFLWRLMRNCPYIARGFRPP